MGHIRDLNAIRCFVMVAKTGSFTAAAERLGQPKSFVSRKIRELESDLQITLFRRGTRRTTLIESAHRFFETCSAALDALKQDAEGFADPTQNRIRLKIGATTDLGTFVLAPLIERKLKDRSRYEIEYALSDEIQDVFDSSLDFTIRMLTVKDERLVARELGTIEVGLFEAPSRRRGSSRRPVALFKGGTIAIKNLILKDRRLESVFRGRELTSTNSLNLIRELVLNYNYQALLPYFVVQDDLKTGALKQVDAKLKISIGKAYIVYAKERYANPDKVKVRDFVESELKGILKSTS